MGKFISNFLTTAEFTTFSASTACGRPHLSLTKDDGKIHMIKDPYNGHDYVEIGGLKWATKNVGANSITDTGLYFQWGDTQGYTASQCGSDEGQKYFGWEDYKFNPSGDGSTFTKYNSTDGKTVLDLSDDAARANMGGEWRIPTTTELITLGNAVNIAWTADYQGSGVAGMVCTDKTDSSKVLFFPVAGYCNNGGVDLVGEVGYYWSSSLHTSNPDYAFFLSIWPEDPGWDGSDFRCIGYTVRGVIG